MALACFCSTWKEITAALGRTQPVTRVPSQGSGQLFEALNVPAAVRPLTGTRGSVGDAEVTGRNEQREKSTMKLVILGAP